MRKTKAFKSFNTKPRVVKGIYLVHLVKEHNEVEGVKVKRVVVVCVLSCW